MTTGQQDDLEALAGEYVLGSLPAEQRLEVEQRLVHDVPLRAAVEAWERRLHPLTALVPEHAPSPQLWARIERSLGTRVVPASAVVSWWDRLALWRWAAAGGLAASIVLSSLLLTRELAPVAPTYLVVLVAPQDKAPGWVIQARDARQIQLIPLGMDSVPEDKALQFWTKGEGWQGPVSLGLVKPGQVLEVPLDALPPLEANQLFELTLENSGGSRTGKPTGPIQFIGRAVKVI